MVTNDHMNPFDDYKIIDRPVVIGSARKSPVHHG